MIDFPEGGQVWSGIIPPIPGWVNWGVQSRWGSRNRQMGETPRPSSLHSNSTWKVKDARTVGAVESGRRTEAFRTRPNTVSARENNAKPVWGPV